MKHILVVDDSRVIRKVAQRIVSDLGLTSTEAENGSVALAICKESMPDAVLLDWNMPVMDGLEFLVALRQLEGGATPKVVFCTTVTEMPQIARALAAGADEYVMKPFDAQILESKFIEVGLLAAA